MKEYSALVLVLVITIITVAVEPHRRQRLKRMLNNPRWVYNLIGIIVFSGYILYVDWQDSDHAMQALTKGFISFVIAIFSELDVSEMRFWLVFVLAYYFQSRRTSDRIQREPCPCENRNPLPLVAIV